MNPQLRVAVFKSPPVKVTKVNMYEFKITRVGNMSWHVYAFPLSMCYEVSWYLLSVIYSQHCCLILLWIQVNGKSHSLFYKQIWDIGLKYTFFLLQFCNLWRCIFNIHIHSTLFHSCILTLRYITFTNKTLKVLIWLAHFSIIFLLTHYKDQVHFSCDLFSGKFFF